MTDISNPRLPPRTLDGEPLPQGVPTQSLSCPRYDPSLTSRPYDTRKVSSNPPLRVRSDPSGSTPTLNPAPSLSLSGVHHLLPIVHVRQLSPHRHAPPFSWWASMRTLLCTTKMADFKHLWRTHRPLGTVVPNPLIPTPILRDFLDSIQLSSAISIGTPSLRESVLVPYFLDSHLDQPWFLPRMTKIRVDQVSILNQLSDAVAEDYPALPQFSSDSEESLGPTENAGSTSTTAHAPPDPLLPHLLMSPHRTMGFSLPIVTAIIAFVTFVTNSAAHPIACASSPFRCSPCRQNSLIIGAP
jgi:hypothetical protein